MKLFISKLRKLVVKIVVVFVEYGIIYYSFLNYNSIYFRLSMKKYYLYQKTYSDFSVFT